LERKVSWVIHGIFRSTVSEDSLVLPVRLVVI
jgi:hypothetical protein